MGASQHLSVTDLVEFADKRRVRKKLIGESLLEAELVCYEPGQGTQEHFHTHQEELYYIVEGSGRVIIGADVHEVTAGDLVYSPADTPHSIETAEERMVMFFVKGPGTAAARAMAKASDG